MKGRDKGIFLLVKTSNAGSADIQDLMITAPSSSAVIARGGGIKHTIPAGNDGAKQSITAGGGRAKQSIPVGGGGMKQSIPVPLYEHVAGLVSAWGEGDGLMGECGYSKVGAVVGATHADVGARLRELMPRTFFLVPGYGAQGATAKDIRRFFDARGSGAIVNSSRGIIGAWKAEGKGAGHVGKSARAAAGRMIDEIGAVL